MEITRQFGAIVLDTVREARARKVFLGMAINGAISALLTMWYVQTIASRTPSSRLTAMARIDPRYLDDAFAAPMVFSAASGVLFWVQMLFSMTMTVGTLAAMLDSRRNMIPGAAPVPRALILLGRYVGTLSTAVVGVAVAFGSVSVATSLKLGVWHARFLWAAAVTLLAIAGSVALMSLLQTALRSQALVLVLLVALSLLSLGARSPEHVRAMTGSEYVARAAIALDSVMPRFAEMATWVQRFVGSGDAGHSSALWSSGLAGIVFLFAACLLFTRREF